MVKNYLNPETDADFNVGEGTDYGKYLKGRATSKSFSKIKDPEQEKVRKQLSNLQTGQTDLTQTDPESDQSSSSNEF